MFIENITDKEIIEFMKGYVKEIHSNLEYVHNNNCKIVVFDIERRPNEVKLLTHVGDKFSALTEQWIFTPYKAFSKNEFGTKEESALLKKWSKFLYTTLKSKSLKIAVMYKIKFAEHLKKEKHSKIAAAKNEYKELSL